MNRTTFNTYLKESRFKELFITEMGWNKAVGNTQLPSISIEEEEFNIQNIAQRSGFQVLVCNCDKIPSMVTCRRIDAKLRRQANDYICIYISENSFHHEWVAPIRSTDKRELVLIEYQSLQQAEFLYSKICDLSFELTENPTIIDVRERIQHAFAVNSEKITKDFYSGFKKEHNVFTSFISGIEDSIPDKENKNKQWYTSVMLNRLMFCYFIQKKGFLDNNYNYLRDKLEWVQKEKGENKFYSTFYRSFLIQLFHDGLNSPVHDESFERKYGRIPYLNGGMFDTHCLEEEFDIDISDDAFIHIFDFFDKWKWHLDTRLTASGKDINPDVLGYIFEQYINDRSAMGAYYTKEDITEYIGKNCIIPCLVDKTLKNINNADCDKNIWTILKNSGDTYIYDSVKKGYEVNWRTNLPEDIQKGLSLDNPNLVYDRKSWNQKTPNSFGLPNEIWRETIERLEECERLSKLIQDGDISDINDFIKYNLDIKQFIYDVLANSTDSNLIGSFYHELYNISILDPTCGSGAFLFSALNILEPLYEICIFKMEELNAMDKNLFVDELEEINANNNKNIQYFIYKNIILHNLYGVDIMVEATEIAKLRLFLKMVAVVDINNRADNMGLDPLPDIDFNIRTGNALVGYANEEELMNDLNNYTDFLQQIANQELSSVIEDKLSQVASTYDKYKQQQLKQSPDKENFKVLKSALKKSLKELEDLLNTHLYQSTADTNRPYSEWLESHKPLHWIADFYHIIHDNHGFDVIIGNPPYVEFPSKDVNYRFDSLVTKTCGNLYGCCIERGLSIGNKNGRFSFIIPVAITCSKRMSPVIDLLKHSTNQLYFSNFDDRPGKLFEMIEHLRATVFIASRTEAVASTEIYSTKYNRWYTENRCNIFKTLRYANVTEFVDSYTIPKFSREIECSINRKIHGINNPLALQTGDSIDNSIYYRAAGGGYFLLIKNEKSDTYINGVKEDVKAEKEIKIKPEIEHTTIGAFISSSLFYWNYIGYTDCRNLLKNFIVSFNCPQSLVNDVKLKECGERLFADYESNKVRKDTYYKSTGRNVIYDEYYPKKSKQILDYVDHLVGQHFGFTNEELDFIINFDIKYRLGDDLFK